MSGTSAFNGFSRETVTFFEELRKNNSKEWFEEHREDYENHVRTPSREFVIAMGNRLKDISPYVHAEPKVNRSLFRIHRDIRFSRDKSPYKTVMGIWFWDGSRHRMECSGYYFHLEPPNLMLGVGVYIFPKSMLKLYRDSVVHPVYGPALVKAVDAVTGKRAGNKAGNKAGKKATPGKKGKGTTTGKETVSGRKSYKLGGRHYKRVPQGYDRDHENAGFLLYNGFHVGIEKKIPGEFFSEKLIDHCFERFEEMYPIHEWLLAMTRRM